MNIEMNDITSSIRKEMEKFDSSIDVSEVGEVIMVGDGIARVSGLENVMSSELIELPNDVMGMAMNLEEDEVGLVAQKIDVKKVKFNVYTLCLIETLLSIILIYYISYKNNYGIIK